MKLTSVSLFLAALSLVEIWRTWGRARRDELGIRSACAWTLLWAGAGTFSLFPSQLDRVLAVAQMENRMFFITVVGLGVLTTTVFSQAGRLDRIRRETARLVQELALVRGQLDALKDGLDEKGPSPEESES